VKLSELETRAAPLRLCRVVLVRPKIAGNLGATARIMRNLGLTDLVLVQPEADPADPRARQQSTQGESILSGARMVSSLGEAVADCVLVAATSARTGGLFRRQSVGDPEQVMRHLVEPLAAGQPVALVFGTEPSGLTNTDVSRCHYLIHIPTDAGYPALNLAQAVAICLYELRRTWDNLRAPPLGAGDDRREPRASFAEQEHMFEQMRQALEDIHFLYGDKREPLMHALRHLLGRAGLSAMEVDILRGLARQIRWYVGEHGSAPTNRTDHGSHGNPSRGGFA
jgi:tRNA/rRNA methyltransferase